MRILELESRNRAHVILGVVFLVLIAFPACSAMAPRLSADDLPSAVRATMDRELRGTRPARIMRLEREGKAAYSVRANAPGDEDIILEIAEDGTLLEKQLEYQFLIKNGRLNMDEHDYWIQSLRTPEAGDPSKPLSVLMKSIYAISEVGGNTLVFDLYGFSKDGSVLSKDSADHVIEIIGVLGGNLMGGMCHVLGPDAPNDAAGRKAAVRAAAKALAQYPELVYWIDGPDAKALAAEFKKIAPDHIVAAPGGDVEVVDSTPSNAPQKPTLLVGSFPEKGGPRLHYLLEGTPADFKAMEAAMTRPIEREPWTPDNSILSEEERREGFVALFDGKTLNGWSGASRGGWIAKDGALHWNKRGAGTLVSRNRYGDFILRFDFRIAKGGNSGVQVRTPRANRASRVGFEMQILGDYGQRPSKSSTGAVYDVIPPTENASKPAMEWNSAEIMCKGPLVKIVVNGKTVQDVNFDDSEKLKDRLRTGFIRLTDHGAYVAYRNIRIREL